MVMDKIRNLDFFKLLRFLFNEVDDKTEDVIKKKRNEIEDKGIEKYKIIDDNLYELITEIDSEFLQKLILTRDLKKTSFTGNDKTCYHHDSLRKEDLDASLDKFYEDIKNLLVKNLNDIESKVTDFEKKLTQIEEIMDQMLNGNSQSRGNECKKSDSDLQYPNSFEDFLALVKNVKGVQIHGSAEEGYIRKYYDSLYSEGVIKEEHIKTGKVVCPFIKGSESVYLKVLLKKSIPEYLLSKVSSEPKKNPTPDGEKENRDKHQDNSEEKKDEG
jgi:hypothetical protein